MSSPDPSRGWAAACALAVLKQDRPLHVELDGCPVCLVRTGGDVVYALYDECTHEQVPLSEGDVEDGAIECFLHGSQFELATGRVLTPPATQSVAVFAVRVADGQVFVNIGGRTSA